MSSFSFPRASRLKNNLPGIQEKGGIIYGNYSGHDEDMDFVLEKLQGENVADILREGGNYVRYQGTYRNGEGQEFPDATLEVFLSDPVYLDADGDIVIPSAWEDFWVLGHELP